MACLHFGQIGHHASKETAAVNRHFIRPALIGALVATAVVGTATAQAASAAKAPRHAKTTTTTTTVAAAVPAAPVTAAHLRVTLTTTSDWAQAHLTPGKIVAAHKTSDSGTGTYTDLAD